MSQVNSVILADSRPANLPLPEDIAELCKAAGDDLRGIPLLDEAGHKFAWVKYDWRLEMGEALTQDWVGRVLNARPGAAVRIPKVYHAFELNNRGFIVMEYIDGSECEDSDVLKVAAAVEALISVIGPNNVPGPIGGGRIRHHFFMEWRSSVTYDTVEVLEKHVNGILHHMRRSRGVRFQRVSFSDEVINGLPLCPCDINRGNFLKGPQGEIVALDFGATCFLPPSFFAVAMAMANDNFTLLLAEHIKYPESVNLNAMVAASRHLVPFGINDIGLPSEPKQS